MKVLTAEEYYKLEVQTESLIQIGDKSSFLNIPELMEAYFNYKAKALIEQTLSDAVIYEESQQYGTPYSDEIDYERGLEYGFQNGGEWGRDLLLTEINQKK